MGKQKIIFICFVPVTNKIKQLQFLDIFESGNFDVEYWSVQPYYSPSLVFPDELTSDSYFKFDNLKEFKARLDSQDKANAILIVDLAAYIYLFRKTFRLIAESKLVATSIYPYSGPSGMKLSLKEKIRRAFSSNILKKLPDFVANEFLLKIYEKLYHIQLKNYCFSSGQPRYKAINHPDYESYLKIRNDNNGIVEGKYIVFIDIYFPLHPDLVVLNKLSSANPELYYNSLRNYFDYLENRFQMPVVIAAHPKSNYQGGELGTRKIIAYKTDLLVKDSQMVINHLSSSTSYAILFNKPSVFITTNEMSKYTKLVYKLKCFALHLNKVVYNIDLVDYENIRFEKFDNNYRKEYIYSYLTTPEIENVSNKEILIKEYNLLFEQIQNSIINQ